MIPPVIETTLSRLPSHLEHLDAAVPHEPERPIGMNAPKEQRAADASESNKTSKRLTSLSQGQKLLERQILAQEEGNQISAGSSEIKANSKCTQSLEPNTKILNMKEEDCEGMIVVIAYQSIKK